MPLAARQLLNAGPTFRTGSARAFADSATSTRCVIVIRFSLSRRTPRRLGAGVDDPRRGIVQLMRTRRGKGDTATITTVAAKANVAPMTVSRVINGGYASPAVRARV